MSTFVPMPPETWDGFERFQAVQAILDRNKCEPGRTRLACSLPSPRLTRQPCAPQAAHQRN